MKHLCIEQTFPVTKLTSFSCENALPDNADGSIQRAQLIPLAPPLRYHRAVLYELPSSPKHQSIREIGRQGNRETVEGATSR